MTENAGGILSRGALIALDAYWAIKLFDYVGGVNIIYQGTHYIHKASADDPNWAVWKYTYSGNNITQIEGPLTGSWTNRATLGWL